MSSSRIGITNIQGSATIGQSSCAIWVIVMDFHDKSFDIQLVISYRETNIRWEDILSWGRSIGKKRWLAFSCRFPQWIARILPIQAFKTSPRAIDMVLKVFSIITYICYHMVDMRTSWNYFKWNNVSRGILCKGKGLACISRGLSWNVVGTKSKAINSVLVCWVRRKGNAS